jgi:quercetin 2,3-dioxygenase
MKIQKLTRGPMPTADPFLFCVYHKDEYPQGSAQMEAPYPGDGMDFDPDADYRMYHGTMIPGFPQHPHRGFETITATMAGLIDHADSVGNAGRYGNGDVQWMTAGKGVVHSEMFPLLDQEDANPLRLFQIWLNLPARSKFVEPGFAMFWAETVPQGATSVPEGVSVTVWAGAGYFGVEENNLPPPNSWASDPVNDVAVMHVVMQPGSSLVIPKAKHGGDINRGLFYVEGQGYVMKIDGQAIEEKVAVTVDASVDIQLDLSNDATMPGEFLLLQGRPIGEPVAQRGPFVMNKDAEVFQAYMDYERTKFGGWPWPRDDMVFDRDKKRFALLHGTETTPPEEAQSTG